MADLPLVDHLPTGMMVVVRAADLSHWWLLDRGDTQACRDVYALGRQHFPLIVALLLRKSSKNFTFTGDWSPTRDAPSIVASFHYFDLETPDKLTEVLASIRREVAQTNEIATAVAVGVSATQTQTDKIHEDVDKILATKKK